MPKREVVMVMVARLHTLFSFYTTHKRGLLDHAGLSLSGFRTSFAVLPQVVATFVAGFWS